MKHLILLIALLPDQAYAGSLYRCIGRDGHVSYQSTKCAAGQQTSRIVKFVRESAVTAQVPKSSSATKRPVASGRVSLRRSAGPEQSRPRECAKAKASREGQLERLGLKRTFDDLSRIDAAVRRACKGFG